jgi:nucleoside-diphosphate-sugar epimerase
VIVAVTGATGYVGRFIVKRLIDARAHIRAWRRPSSDRRGLPEAIEWIDGDLALPDAAAPLVEGADILVHAALEHAPGRYRGGEGNDLARYLSVNVGGSLALLAAARRAGVKRAVVLSSRAVFSSSVVGSIPDEASTSPDTHYGASKVALEAFVSSFSREGWAIAALRPTGVYGLVEPPERSKWFALVKRALEGEAIEPRAGSEVHGDDVAESVWRLLTAKDESVAGRAFNCSDVVVSTRDIVAEVQRAAGVVGPLPDKGPEPKGVMRSDALRALGVTFGGMERFRTTVEELVAAAR